MRTGRAAISMVEPVQVEAYGSYAAQPTCDRQRPGPRLISVQVWDKSMVHAVEKASSIQSGLSPETKAGHPFAPDERRTPQGMVSAHK